MKGKFKVHIRINLCMVLFVTFLVLKLTNAISWSWWWVAAPLWIPASAALAVIVVLGVYVLWEIVTV